MDAGALPQGRRTTHEKEHTDEFVSSVAQNSRPIAGRPPPEAAPPSGQRDGAFHTRTSPPLPADTTHSSGGLGGGGAEVPLKWAGTAAEAAVELGCDAAEGSDPAVTFWMVMTGPLWTVRSSQRRGLASRAGEAEKDTTGVDRCTILAV